MFKITHRATHWVGAWFEQHVAKVDIKK